jgi:alpha-tubulin suppressor-like RCC1 family protein
VKLSFKKSMHILAALLMSSFLFACAEEPGFISSGEGIGSTAQFAQELEKLKDDCLAGSLDPQVCQSWGFPVGPLAIAFDENGCQVGKELLVAGQCTPYCDDLNDPVMLLLAGEKKYNGCVTHCFVEGSRFVEVEVLSEHRDRAKCYVTELGRYCGERDSSLQDVISRAYCPYIEQGLDNGSIFTSIDDGSFFGSADEADAAVEPEVSSNPQVSIVMIEPIFIPIFRYTPPPLVVALGTASQPTRLFAGGANTCVYESESKKLHCWGKNSSGQMGLPSSTSQKVSKARQLPLKTSFNLNDLTFGRDGLVVLGRDGLNGFYSLFCLGWMPGRNCGSDSSLLTSFFKDDSRSITRVGSWSESHCLIAGPGGLRCSGDAWGSSTVFFSQQIDGGSLSGIIGKMDLGHRFGCLRTSDDDVHCWGESMKGQLGSGVVTESKFREKTRKINQFRYFDVSGLNPSDLHHKSKMASGLKVKALAVGVNHACAVRKGSGEGDVYCWGSNDKGQAGYKVRQKEINLESDSRSQNVATNSTQEWHRYYPMRVQYDSRRDVNGDIRIYDTFHFSRLTNIIDVSAGNDFTCALQDNGHVYCWGDNSSGQLGKSTSEIGSESHHPILVPHITDARAIASGSAHTCALLNSGQVRCWGANGWGQLGSGSDDSIQIGPRIVVK